MRAMQLHTLVTASNRPVIVEASALHMPAVQAIYAHYVQHSVCTMETLAPSVAEMHQRHDAMRRQALPWLVALDGKEVVGYAYAGRYRLRVGYSGTVESSIYVHPERQGQGIGPMLLDALILECTSLSLRQIVAVIVRDTDTAGSIRLHERFEFKHSGVFEQVGHKFGKSVDTVLMQRALAAA